MYCAYVTRIHNLRKHTNADRLLCGECFGNTVIVDLGTDPDQLGVYFPTDGKLGLEFAQKNDLLRRKDENGAPAGGYLDPEKRNIKALKLRGEKSDGLFLPLSCLASFTDIKKLQEMEHPYPATMDKIEAFGYDPKQLHHALRLREFMTRYEAGEPYADCLISNQCDYLKEVKRGCYSLKEARALMSTAIQSMTEDKKRYMDTVPVSINQHANEVLQKATVEILKRSFLKEIQGGE